MFLFQVEDPFDAACNAGIVVDNSLSSPLFRTAFISPLYLKDTVDFTSGFSFNILNISFYSLLDCKVSDEKKKISLS